ncbi:hypothetical protein K9M79_01445 [Candidatus Woesearchaeota archaeon]|nr:hypothetical protein [Candidatus Woesearchaeota archaeon]
MIVRDRILECLKDSPKTNKELHEAIPDKSTRIISATISLNKDIFLRLEKGLTGLKNRDEHLVTGRPIKSGKMCLYKKMVNLLAHGERRLEDLYEAMPDEKKVSIRATVNVMPHLFIRVAQGVIGRTGRDEWLIEKYKLAKASTVVRKPKRRTISEQITSFLLNGEKTLKEIHHAMPTYPRKSITSKLTLNPKFEKLGDGKWRLRQ